MNYTSLQLTPTGLVVHVKRTIVVSSDVIHSTASLPKVVGISMVPGRCPSDFLGKSFQRLALLKRFFLHYHPNFLLCLRSLLAYFISRVDYVARGSYMPDNHISQLQSKLNSLFRNTLMLHPSTSNAAILLPVKHLGWGCPNLRHRTHLHAGVLPIELTGNFRQRHFQYTFSNILTLV